MTNKKIKKQKGRGIIDATANMVLINKHNRLLPGHKHQIIYLPDGTYNSVRYSGPGTQLETRLRRGDKPLSYVDTVAQAHDLPSRLDQGEDTTGGQIRRAEVVVR